MRHGSRLWWLLVPGVLAAQTPASVQHAVRTITPEDVRRRIDILADDSMRGRDTPSPELEEVASYIAGEFRRFGLEPGGDDGSYLQRYRIDRVQLVPESSMVWSTGAAETKWQFGPDVVYLGTDSTPEVAGPAMILTGQIVNGVGFDSGTVAGKVVILPGGARSVGGSRRFARWHPLALVTYAAVSDSTWLRIAARVSVPSLRDPTGERPLPPVVLAREAAVRPFFARAGLDPSAARGADGPLQATVLNDVTLHLVARQRPVERRSAPNVIGILPGSDPTLKNEYVFFTGHMDHIGVAGPGSSCVARGADSICNGADDDASGTTAVIVAAQAFSQLQPHPKRSLVFMTVSGEEKGLWGSGYFVAHPTVPLDRIVADLNTDMVGRNWKDTVAVIGQEQSDLGATLTRVAAAHPELHMTPIDDIWPQEGFYYRSDHYNFARKGVPILFFFNGTHPDYHQVSDSPDKIDAEKESRIVRLDFYLGLEVANAPERPQWNPESYKRIVTAN